MSRQVKLTDEVECGYCGSWSVKADYRPDPFGNFRCPLCGGLNFIDWDRWIQYRLEGHVKPAICVFPLKNKRGLNLRDWKGDRIYLLTVKKVEM